MSTQKVFKKSSFVLNGKDLIDSLKPHLEDAIKESINWSDPIELDDWVSEFTSGISNFVEEVNDWQFEDDLDPDSEEVSVTFVDGTDGVLVEVCVSYDAPESEESVEVSDDTDYQDPAVEDLVDEIIQRLNRLGLSVDKKSRIINILTE